MRGAGASVQTAGLTSQLGKLLMCGALTASSVEPGGADVRRKPILEQALLEECPPRRMVHKSCPSLLVFIPLWSKGPRRENIAKTG